MEQVNKKQIDIVLKTIKRMEKTSEVRITALRKELKSKDLGLSDMQEAIKLLMRSGDIYKPKEGFVKVL